MGATSANGGPRKRWSQATVSQRVDGRGVLHHHSTATTAAPGVVLCVADGIVRIVVHVVAGEDLGGRLRRGIGRLIGGGAGERERCGREDDAEPPVGRLFGGCAR